MAKAKKITTLKLKKGASKYDEKLKINDSFEDLVLVKALANPKQADKK